MTPVPPASTRPVAIWLFVVCAVIFVMVVLGGVTRLTHSGLSMVEWRPLLGWLPPLTDARWEELFAKYREFPEYRKLNPNMVLAGFKSIFWLEYMHRLLGRLIGVVFLVPFVYFLVRRRIAGRLVPRAVIMLVLGGLQGALGWYMVQSGLAERPDVSQYRLAAHLALAFAIYGYIFWVAMGLVDSRPAGGLAPAGRGAALALVALVALTVLSGAFVAGLDAGLIYNSFPLMGGRLVPEDMFVLEPVLLNFFENRAAVQFDHRVLAIATFVAVVAFWATLHRVALPRRARAASSVLFLATGIQVLLGISTLLLFVPVALAALHQAMALVLFTVALWTLHELTRGQVETAG